MRGRTGKSLSYFLGQLLNKLPVPKSLSQSASGVLIGHALKIFSGRERDFSGPMTESEEEKREGDCEAGQRRGVRLPVGHMEGFQAKKSQGGGHTGTVL